MGLKGKGPNGPDLEKKYNGKDSINQFTKQGFSYYGKGIVNKVPSGIWTAQKTYEVVKTGEMEITKGVTLKSAIQELALLPYDSDEQKNLKKKIPYVTPSGTFTMRETEGLIQHSELICLDIDKKDNPHLDPETFRDQIMADGVLSPSLAFRSTRLEGVKVWLYVPGANAGNHKARYNTLIDYVAKEYGVKIDASGSDIPRACFLSYDPDAVFNRDGVTNINSVKAAIKEIPSLDSPADSAVRLDEIGRWEISAIVVQVVALPVDPLRPNDRKPDRKTNWNDFVRWVAAGVFMRLGVVSTNDLPGLIVSVTEIMWENNSVNWDEEGYKEFKSAVRSAAKYNLRSREKRKLEINEKAERLKNIIRVGNTYLKTIEVYNRFGEPEQALGAISRQTIVDDYGRGVLKKIRKFDAFCNVPDHTNHKAVIRSNYNLYQPLPHEPKKGTWQTVDKLFKHIFKEHYQYGLDYLQIAYLRPTQILPVLCLVSEENETGKTTFARFLKAVFGSNTAIIGSNELKADFNSAWATKLFVCVDEASIPEQTVHKVKMQSTATTVQIRKMHTDYQEIEFFGKFVLLSNDETSFIKAGKYDNRYWVRKVPKLSEFDPEFENKLKNEVPAFLHFLNNRELSTKPKSRMYFSIDDLTTSALERLRENSKSKLRQEIEYTALEYMESHDLKFIDCTPRDIKLILLCGDNRIVLSEIRNVLKNEMGVNPVNGSQRYKAITGESKTGSFYRIRKSAIKADDCEDLM